MIICVHKFLFFNLSFLNSSFESKYNLNGFLHPGAKPNSTSQLVNIREHIGILFVGVGQSFITYLEKHPN